ncbi:hypothetical protein Tco_1568474 [Tanacetum coccineum]
MDDPNITIEEYIRLEEEKAQKRGKVFGKLLSMVRSDMPPLPSHDQRHLWLRYQVEGYTEEIVHDFEDRLNTIYGRQDGKERFVSHAWRRLIEIRSALVCEFILEFLSTCRIGNEIGLDAADALCFQLGGARRSMTWRQFILTLGLHTTEEMAEDGFEAYYMDQGITNIPYLLAHYLFMHAEGRKSDARLSGGHFIGRLAHHFGLVSDDELRGLSIVTQELPLIDMGELVVVIKSLLDAVGITSAQVFVNTTQLC